MFSVLVFIKPSTYDTIVLTNGGSVGAVFDDSYKVYLADESLGNVDIRYIENGLNDWGVHAVFRKAGTTEIILESKDGDRSIYEITVKNKTYDINKK